LAAASIGLSARRALAERSGPIDGQVLAWARERGEERVWAVEDCRHVTRGLEETGMKDQRGPYFRSLEESPRLRAYWRGIDPDDSAEWAGVEWLFETVEEDAGRCIAIKQMIIRPSGAVSRYWCEHLEDADCFLTDQPVDYTDKLDAISADEFHRLWRE
jgi:hypothetical protein